MAGSSNFSPDSTKEGTLPPFEVAKCIAFAKVLEKVEEVLGEEAHVLLGMGKNEFIASQLQLKGGGNSQPRTVQKTLAKCSDASWYLGKGQGVSTGRPPVFTGQ